MSSSSIVDSKSNNNKINGTSSNNPLGFCYHDTATPITIRNNDGSNDGGSYSNNKINSTSNNNPESSAPKDNNNNSDGGFASSTKLRSNKENRNQEQSNDKCISSTGNHLGKLLFVAEWIDSMRILMNMLYFSLSGNRTDGYHTEFACNSSIRRY